MELILNKIKLLFQERQLIKILNTADIHEKKRHSFHQKLVDLQFNIYSLDRILESEWDISKKERSERWSAIYNSLKEFGLSESECKFYCNEIEVYESHELEIRLGILPVSKSMETFYFYKTCDIRLIRRLIREFTGDPLEDMAEDLWKPYDMLTELKDDIEDLDEDCQSYNGNYILFMLAFYGLSASCKIIDQFIQSLYGPPNQDGENKFYPKMIASSSPDVEEMEYFIQHYKKNLQSFLKYTQIQELPMFKTLIKHHFIDFSHFIHQEGR